MTTICVRLAAACSFFLASARTSVTAADIVEEHAGDLVDSYQHTALTLASCRFKATTILIDTFPTAQQKTLQKLYYSQSSDLSDICTISWTGEYGLNEEPDPSQAVLRREQWDGETLRTYAEDPRNKYYALFVMHGKPDLARGRYRTNRASLGGPLNGVFPGVHASFAETLTAADLRTNDPKVFGGVTCPGVSAITPRGRYNVWFDPEHGYNVRFATVDMAPNDTYYDEPLSATLAESVRQSYSDAGVPTAPKSSLHFECQILAYENVGGSWLAAEGEWKTVITHQDGAVQRRDGRQVRTSFAKLGSDYMPDPIAVRPGTQVIIDGENPVIPMRWRDGAVRPEVDIAVVRSMDRAVVDMRDRHSSEHHHPAGRTPEWLLIALCSCGLGWLTLGWLASKHERRAKGNE